MIWATIAGVVAVTMLAKGIGPTLVGGRRPSDRLAEVIGLMAAALLAALVLVDVAGPRWADFDPAMLAGLATAGGAWYLRAPLPLPVLAGMAVVAVVRLIQA